MSQHSDGIAQSLEHIRRYLPDKARIGIVLGSGLGDFADTLPGAVPLNTSEIPGYPRSSVAGHRGRIVFAPHKSGNLVAFQGRVHFYESNSLDSVLFPIRIAAGLGVSTLVLTNAAGGVNKTFHPGDLMVLKDQINLTTLSISGNNTYALEPQHSVYDAMLVERTLEIGRKLGMMLRSGTYAGVKGPSYETAAEVEMIARIGGDAVGMSTVLEASLAKSLHMQVLGISCITNLATGISSTKLDHAEVTEVGNMVKDDFRRLVVEVLNDL